MPTSARSARAEQDAIRACHSGSDVCDLRGEVLRAVRRIMSVDAAFLATADPETLLFTGAWPEAPLDAATELFLDNEFGRRDVNKFAMLATATRHVASLDEVTRQDRSASARYRQVMRPLGLGDELRAALVAGGQCWGYLCLHREDDRAGFSRADAAALARLAPHIAQGLRNAMLLHGSPAPATAVCPGVVLLAEDLSVVAITAEAEQLLSLIAEDRTSRLPLPTPVYAAAATLRAVEGGAAGASSLPSARVPTRAGPWLNVHASRLSGVPNPEQIAVIVEPAEPHAVVPILLSAHGLTAREAEVARLVLRGDTTRVIADTLHISRHTVQDHLKSVFDKTGVRSRRGLVGYLLSPPGA